VTDKTKTALAGAVEAHSAARAGAALSGQDPAEVDPGDAVAAAQAHLASVDRGYEAREGGKPPHDRVAAPDVKGAYDKALAAWQDDPGDPELREQVDRLGGELAAARTAARVAEGRWDLGVHAEGGEG
jgi:hypothetical protein